MGNPNRHFMNEADIGSGDKTAADYETQKLIEEIGADKKNSASQKDAKRQHEIDSKQNAGLASNR